VPEIRIQQTQFQREPDKPEEPRSAKTAPAEPSPIRQYLLSRGNSAIADRAFKILMVLCALSIFAIVGLIAWQLVASSQLTWQKFGIGFFYKTFTNSVTNEPLYWDPVNEQFSALPFIYGTLVSSFLALLIAVPLGVGLAIFLTEMSPRVLRGPLAFLTELLAAIPSVIYGLWAVFVLVPLLRQYVNPLLTSVLGWTGFFTNDNPTGLGFSGRRNPGDHDSSHHFIAHSRGDERRTSLATRGGVGARRHALGDDQHGCASECAHRHCRVDHSRFGSSAG